MNPEEITTHELQESAFAELLTKALPAPALQALPPGLSERIALATYARPSFWETLTLALRPAPVRLALGGALSAGVLCAVFLPHLPKTPPVPVSVASTQPSPKQGVAAVETKTEPPAVPASPAPPVTVAALSTPAPSVPDARPTAKPTGTSVKVKPVETAAPSPRESTTKVAVVPFKERTRIAPELSAIGRPHASTSGALAGHTAPAVTATTVASARTKGEPEVTLTAAPLVTQPTPTPSASRTPRMEVALASGEEEKIFRVALDVTNEQMKQEGKIGSLRPENSVTVAVRPGSNLDLLSAPVK